MFVYSAIRCITFSAVHRENGKEKDDDSTVRRAKKKSDEKNHKGRTLEGVMGSASGIMRQYMLRCFLIKLT
jgi:hypothetical protein